MTNDISTGAAAARNKSRLCHAAATAFAALLGLAPMAQQATARDLPLPDPGQGRFTVLAHPAPAQAALRLQQQQILQTIPSWSHTVTSPLDGQTYTYVMAGSSPFAGKKNVTTKISYIPIVVKYHFGSTILDATKHSCGDTKPISARFLASPLFNPDVVTSNGVDVSAGSGATKLQLLDGFQRANFWSSAGGTKFGVDLVKGGPAVVVNLYAPAGAQLATGILDCGGVAKRIYLVEVDINALDAQIQSLVTAYATPSQIPLILTHNVVATDSNGCCILGYHSAMPAGGTVQTYAVGGYFDSGLFANVDDIVTWSHELAEWMDDPFVNNATPAWGDTGQVTDGCQNDLEAADPLTGTEFAKPGAGGFTYHFQDLAFSDWFFRTPSQGTGGKYSFKGTFASAQAACH